MAGCRVTFCHVASTLRRASRRHFPVDAWLHRRCPFHIAVAPSIAVAVALLLCRPSPPSLVGCCRFHCHRHINIHPPLLPLRSLCCACHRRPLPSRHPSPPSLVDCCIFHVHCRIAVHYPRSVAPTIAVDAVAVALPSRCPCPSLPLLVDCCLAIGSHCNRCADHRCHSTVNQYYGASDSNKKNFAIWSNMVRLDPTMMVSTPPKWHRP